MTVDAQSLLDTFSLACWRCGKREPDAFEDLAAVEAALTVRPPLTSRVQIMAPAGIGTIQAGDLAAGKPVHRRCLPRPEPPPRADGSPGYDILRSVA